MILVRLPDIPCCTTDVTVLVPGKGPHAGELKCEACGRHRRWMPAAALSLLQQFQNETTRLFGPSDGLPVMRSSTIQFGDKTMSFEKKKFNQDNSGALFKNKKKTTDQHADYTGTISFEGRDCWLSAWIKTPKAGGEKYMSLSLKPKEGDL
jgi:hypothetical protein